MSYASRVRFSLSEWITLLLAAVPPRSRATFVELLCACMILPEGWVTRAISAIHRQKHWTTYYKLLQRGSVKVLPLAQALFRLVLNVLPDGIITLVIDDTLVPRTSKDAPGCDIRHDHAKKSNRPQYLLSQCWVTLGVSVQTRSGINLALPILSRLVPNVGNRNKLSIARALVRAIAPMATRPIRLLFDSWFMRARLVMPLLRRGIQVIGQARRDTALFLPPVAPANPTKPPRGRTRKYGIKLTLEAVDALPVTQLTLKLYGKEQLIRVRSVVALAQFLKGTKVRAVWCEFYDADKCRWSKARLLLATELELTAEEILRAYARRWSIEPLFHNLKRWWDVNNLWQQSRRVLELWMQIRSMAWTLTQLLSLTVEQAAFPLAAVAPWRFKQSFTAGLVAQWMRVEFTGLPFRDGFDRKSQKSSFPKERKDPRMRM